MELFEGLGVELDKESWEWLLDNHPLVARELQKAVNNGATPEQLRSFVVRRCGINRLEMARRCENAGRHLLSEAKK